MSSSSDSDGEVQGDGPPIGQGDWACNHVFNPYGPNPRAGRMLLASSTLREHRRNRCNDAVFQLLRLVGWKSHVLFLQPPAAPEGLIDALAPVVLRATDKEPWLQLFRNKDVQGLQHALEQERTRALIVVSSDDSSDSGTLPLMPWFAAMQLITAPLLPLHRKTTWWPRWRCRCGRR
jgi:hypothetical protein